MQFSKSEEIVSRFFKAVESPTEPSSKNEDTKSLRSVISNKLEQKEPDFKRIPPLYSELENLFFHGDESETELTDKYEWKVTSRWIKYEQAVNKITNKWGDPHLGPLLYQELVYLKNSLLTGSIILNCRHSTIDAVFDEVLEDLVNRGQVILERKSTRTRLISHILSTGRIFLCRLSISSFAVIQHC